jgi:cytochrome c biogenesis protein CcmG, thiol:disulfide interchange protein DsbE
VAALASSDGGGMTASTRTSTPRARWLLWMPFGLVALLGLLFIWGLRQGGESRLIRSQWIDKPVPAFDLPPAMPGQPGLSSRNFADGKPRLLNVFASWCIPCRVEAPQLEELRRRGVIIEGIAIRDRQEDLARFLAETGNPYTGIGADTRSQVQIALGSSGVPETFLVDGNGIIREQIQGVITADMMPEINAKLARMAQ